MNAEITKPGNGAIDPKLLPIEADTSSEPYESSLEPIEEEEDEDENDEVTGPLEGHEHGCECCCFKRRQRRFGRYYEDLQLYRQSETYRKNMELGKNNRDIKELYLDPPLLNLTSDILQKKMEESAKNLVNLLPWYPRWVLTAGKPYRGLTLTEAFLFFFALNVMNHFSAICYGYLIRNKKNETKWEYDQNLMEAIMLVWAFMLHFYHSTKRYIFIYVWIVFKIMFYWNFVLHYLVTHDDLSYIAYTMHGIRTIIDFYISYVFVYHSLATFARGSYVYEIFSEMLAEDDRLFCDVIDELPIHFD